MPSEGKGSNAQPVTAALQPVEVRPQLHRVQQDLKLRAIEREPNLLHRQQQRRERELQQQRQVLQEQSRTKRMQQDLNR